MNTLNHLGIIIDGNRRFAKKKLLQTWKGHNFGAENVEKTIEWCADLKIKELTFYALSLENLKREKKEVEALLDLMRKWLIKIKRDNRIQEKGVKIRFVGRLHLLPENIQREIQEVEETTRTHKNMLVTFCVAYGGRQEVIDAVKNLVKNKVEINEDNFLKNLYLQSEPDLIIRTGDRSRTSNFLIWQSIYSEWIFLEKLWPEFAKDDLLACIEKFKVIQRNFGK